MKREFLRPNYLATVVNQMSDPYLSFQRLEHGESEASVRKDLESRGLTVVAIDAYDFTEWQSRAKTLTDNIKVEYPMYRARRDEAKKKKDKDQKDKSPFKADLWAELKDYLLRLFDGRCAYCEAIIETVAHGEVEHYRPKAKVEEDDTHSGYFWLAYDETNYFPACSKCNGARAKMNHFPLAENGQRARGPQDDLSLERPLLLNPYQDNFSEHLTFRLVIVGEFPACTVSGTTPKGETSITVYHLKRGPLLNDRGKECATAISDVYRNVALLGKAQAIDTFLKSLPRRQFPSACVDVVAKALELKLDW